MAGAGVEFVLVGQVVPVDAGVGVVFDVVAIVEEKEVIEAAIVAGGAAGVLVFALEPAESEAKEITGNVGGEEKFWGGCGDGGPEKETTPSTR